MRSITEFIGDSVAVFGEQSDEKYVLIWGCLVYYMVCLQGV
jgi:hypothetical protein